MNRTRRLLATLGAVGAALAAMPLVSAAPAQGVVVLTVSGKAAAQTGAAAGGVDFDMAQLAQLPQHTFTTRTPWYPAPRTFTGPLLRDVLAAGGVKGETLRAVALNDYKVDIPFADAQRHPVIVARLLDGKPMPVREKGPLFIVYPFDSRAELRSERYYARSAWQLRRIEVR